MTSPLPPVSNRSPVSANWFVTTWQAVVWRNWGLVPLERLARALQATPAQLRGAAAQLGLDPNKDADPVWSTRGYLTIIRENWHLCTYEQICQMLDMSPETLAFILKEDDFFWHKMGEIKPLVEAPAYRPLSSGEINRTKQKADQLKAMLPDQGWQEENAFAFINHFSRQLSGQERAEAIQTIVPDDNLRTVYSYFALYGDPLLTPELDPFPEALLAEYAKMGVKGVWLQGILYQLVPFSFAPERSNGYQKRLETLNALIKRAARYDIGVFLYLNEPRAMDEAFFQKHPNLRGTREGDFWAMCTSCPEVKAYLENATRTLFNQAPGLAGFFTITMSENLTNCYSRTGDGHLCSRCAERHPWEVVAEVNNLLARGAKAANPEAKAIAWNWAWRKEWQDNLIPLLTEGQIIQCTSETGLPTAIAGVNGSVSDYTMSLAGPGRQARDLWQTARANGLEACAKVQFNNTWEMSAVPWLPVFDRIAEHVKNLREASVQHLQLSWTLGGYPSPNLKLVSYLMGQQGTVPCFLETWLGNELGNVADQAQKHFSKAFTEFPFHIGVLYVGPQNYGPMVPFHLEKTGWKATMIGFPYDDLDSWRAIYPRDVFASQFEKLVNGWRAGMQTMEPWLGRSEDFDDLHRIAEATLCHFTSTWHQVLFVMHRDAWLAQHREDDRQALLRLIDQEKDVVLRLISLRRQDSRIGYESSNHYYYTLQDLAEKLLNLQDCADQLR